MDGFDRRALGDGAFALVSTLLEADGFLAAFFERTGGTSRPPFDSLNVSYGAGDDPVAVGANRRKAAEAFGLDGYAVPGLVHATRVTAVGRRRARDGYHGPANMLRDADGLHTRTAGLPLAGFSADCAIAVLASPPDGRVAMIHAGWRGMAAGILGKGVRLFERAADVRVAIGPAIGPCHYEVGEDVVHAMAGAASGGAVVERRRGRTCLDLVATTRRLLAEAGVRRVDDTGLCTACEEQRLFSYRREATTGRHLALAMSLPR